MLLALGLAACSQAPKTPLAGKVLAIDQALRENAATALETCRAGRVGEVSVRGFTCKP